MEAVESRALKQQLRRNDPLASLNPKHRAFVMEYCRDGNASRAAEAAGYQLRSASARGAELLQRADVQQAINATLQARAVRIGVDEDRVVAELALLAFAQDGSVSNRDKLKALELLARHLGMFDDRLTLKVDDADIIEAAKRAGLEPEELISEAEYYIKEGS